MHMLARRLMLTYWRQERSDDWAVMEKDLRLFIIFDGCFDGCHCNSQELTGIVVTRGFCKGGFLQESALSSRHYYITGNT